MYTLKKLRRLYLAKVAVIFTIATFLLNQGVEALVIAEIFPVWSLRFSLIATAITFPFVMYIAYLIIYKKHNYEKESFEDRVLNFWLLIFSILVLVYAVIERFYQH